MYKRIVIKIGSGVITEDGRLDERAIERIVGQVADLRKAGVETILISSGAGAAGKGILASSGSGGISDRQVFSSVGQIALMTLYAKLFESRDYRCAQILVTKEDFRDKQHYANMKNCFENLLRENIVPIVNENDPIAATGMSFTDNDELAGLIASQLNAEAVIILSGVDGVLQQGKAIAEIGTENISEAEKHIAKEKSATGRGGMKTKFEIAKKLMAQGIATHIANGAKENIILDIVEGKQLGTTFVPERKLSAIKRRLAHAGDFAAGSVYVNKGAEEILLSGQFKSLLPVGITKVEGDFKKGDVILILNESGNKLGAGIAQYDADSARSALGQKGGKALVHYDYLFIG